jgi:SAM-dependent methyltransferase
VLEPARRRWARAYARMRKDEGRGGGGEGELFALPYVTTGPLASQWRVRARTFDAFLGSVVVPLEKERGPSLDVLDLGAGNGWLSARLSTRGHRCVAADLRLDDVDGLAAAVPFARRLSRMFARVAASFDALPVKGRRFDLVVFDAAIHLAEDLARVLAEAVRAAAPGGRVAILDSPFYPSEAPGEAMRVEKRRETAARFSALADDLLAISPVEYLTPARLAQAAAPSGLVFRRRRVLYPVSYETRGVVARLKGARIPSRFDLWVARVERDAA